MSQQSLHTTSRFSRLKDIHCKKPCDADNFLWQKPTSLQTIVLKAKLCPMSSSISPHPQQAHSVCSICMLRFQEVVEEWVLGYFVIWQEAFHGISQSSTDWWRWKIRKLKFWNRIVVQTHDKIGCNKICIALLKKSFRYTFCRLGGWIISTHQY